MILNCIYWWGSSYGAWRVWSTPSLPLPPGPLWPRVVVTIYFYMGGGARGVIVIVAGYGHGDTSSNPRPDWLYFP